MSLPSFPDFDKKPNKPSVKPSREPQDNFGSLPSLELPDLDSLLDDEYSISDEYQSSQEDFYIDPEDSPEKEEYEEDTGFTTIDTEEEVYDFEDREESPEDFDEEFSLEDDNEEDTDDDGGFVIEDEEEEEEYEEEEEFEELELPPEAYEAFSVLPNVMPEEDEEDLGFELMTEEAEEEKTEVEKPKLKKEKKPKNSKGFKEMDDESVKEFFLDIKDRILGIIPSVGRKQKKQPSKPKQKIRKPKSKLRSIISGIIMLALIAGLGLTFVSNLGFKTLEESVITTNADELSLEFSEFRESEGKLVFTAKNKADISADFIINVSVKTKSLIPFMGKEMKGVSDIIALEPDMSGEYFVNLEDLNMESKYKITFAIVQLP
jgi:hypothetical protein